MLLSEETKKRIADEYNEQFETQYAGRSIKERQDFGQFFTPPKVSIKMIEKLPYEEFGDKTIIDPTAGCAGLLVAAVIAGAKPENVYGIEIDPDIILVARKRLERLGVPSHNIQLANALDETAYDFSEENQINIQKKYINYIFSDDALNSLSFEGWGFVKADIKELVTKANTVNTLDEVLTIRYSLYDIVDKIDKEKCEYDLSVLFSKYAPDDYSKPVAKRLVLKEEPEKRPVDKAEKEKKEKPAKEKKVPKTKAKSKPKKKTLAEELSEEQNALLEARRAKFMQ